MAAFVYDAALIAYPLYGTSKHLTSSPQTSPQSESESAARLCEAERWLRFWLTFGGIKLLENMGANSIPFFYVFEGIVLMSMYSAEHSVFVAGILPKFCDVYVRSWDRAQQTLNQQTVVTQANTSWLTGAWHAWHKVFAFWNPSSKVQKTE